MNSSREHPDGWKQFEDDLVRNIWKYCWPVLMAFGTSGNVLSIVVLCKKPMRNSAISSSLTLIAAIDLLFLYCSSLPKWLRFFYSIRIRELHSLACSIHLWVSYSLAEMAPWSLVFVTVERLRSIYRPLDTWKEESRKWLAPAKLLAMWVVFLVVDSHVLYGFAVIYRKNNTVPDCNPVSDSYHNFYIYVWIPLYFALSFYIPAAILLCSNCAILWRLNKGFGDRHVAMASRNTPNKRRDRASNNLKIVLSLNLLFVFTNVPINVVMVAQRTILVKKYGKLFWAIAQLLMYVNNSTNFFFYLLSREFRMELFGIFCRKSAVKRDP